MDEGFAFDHPDDPYTRYGISVLNTSGQEFRFGALKVGEATVAYFLASVNTGETVTIVDLVDAPPGADDFRINDSHIDIIGSAGAGVLAAYDVVVRSLVPSGAVVEASSADTSAPANDPQAVPALPVYSDADVMAAWPDAERPTVTGPVDCGVATLPEGSEWISSTYFSSAIVFDSPETAAEYVQSFLTVLDKTSVAEVQCSSGFTYIAPSSWSPSEIGISLDVTAELEGATTPLSFSEVMWQCANLVVRVPSYDVAAGASLSC